MALWRSTTLSFCLKDCRYHVTWERILCEQVKSIEKNALAFGVGFEGSPAVSSLGARVVGKEVSTGRAHEGSFMSELGARVTCKMRKLLTKRKSNDAVGGVEGTWPGTLRD